MRISDWSSDVCSSDLRRGAELRVERLGQLERGQRLFDVDMRAHRDGMDPRIGAPRAEHLRRIGGEAVDRLFDGLLAAGAVGLPLPAHTGAAVIFDRSYARRVGPECVSPCGYQGV